jgi:hypothetical protein
MIGNREGKRERATQRRGQESINTDLTEHDVAVKS